MDVTAPAILEIGLVLLAAAAAGWLVRRAGLPAVLGYLAVGLAVSPFTPGYVANRAQLLLLADVGVVLLLFEVGIEVDLFRLRREQRGLLWAAAAQTLGTTVLAALVLRWAGLSVFGAAVLGLGIAMSSSVVIINITRSRKRTTDRITERTLVGWSVIQDVMGVVLATILLAISGLDGRGLGAALLGFLGFGAIALVVAWLFPWVLRRLQHQHDLFLIASVATGLVIASLGSVVFGIPLALAAFVAGLTITESHEAGEARRRLMPFRDVFAVLFFVAIGTLVDLPALTGSLGWLGLILGLVVVGKLGVSYGLARLARLSAHPWQLAVGLSQIGEFGFVLASLALARAWITPQVHAALLAAMVVTIGCATVVVRSGRPGHRPPSEEQDTPATP
ncbi:MAG: cation:proton antiporter [Actinobacteria bacterium]|nr:cation:proton antiporter [Actinomycetota bacterium]